MAVLTIADAKAEDFLGKPKDPVWIKDNSELSPGDIVVRAMFSAGKLYDASIYLVREAKPGSTFFRAWSAVEIKYDYFGEGVPACSTRYGSGWSVGADPAEWTVYGNKRVSVVRRFDPSDAFAVRDMWRPDSRHGTQFGAWLVESGYKTDAVRKAFRDAFREAEVKSDEKPKVGVRVQHDGKDYITVDRPPENGDLVLTCGYGIWEFKMMPSPIPFWGNPDTCRC